MSEIAWYKRIYWILLSLFYKCPCCGCFAYTKADVIIFKTDGLCEVCWLNCK